MVLTEKGKRSTRPRLLSCLVAAGAVALLAAPPAAAHRIKHDTTVALTACVPASCPPTTDSFRGTLTAERDRCEPDRRVNVFREQDQALIGSSLSVLAGPDATWEVSTGGNPGSGDYFAVAKRRIFSPGNHRHICRRGVSNSVSITSS